MKFLVLLSLFALCFSADADVDSVIMAGVWDNETESCYFAGVVSLGSAITADGDAAEVLVVASETSTPAVDDEGFFCEIMLSGGTTDDDAVMTCMWVTILTFEATGTGITWTDGSSFTSDLSEIVYDVVDSTMTVTFALNITADNAETYYEFLGEFEAADDGTVTDVTWNAYIPDVITDGTDGDFVDYTSTTVGIAADDECVAELGSYATKQTFLAGLLAASFF